MYDRSVGRFEEKGKIMRKMIQFSLFSWFLFQGSIFFPIATIAQVTSLGSYYPLDGPNDVYVNGSLAFVTGSDGVIEPHINS